jgi:hypothetical protein
MLVLDQPHQRAYPGDVVHYAGRLSSSEKYQVFIATVSAGLDDPRLTPDISPFDENMPLSMTTAGSASGPMLDVVVGDDVPAGLYEGTILLKGGAKASSSELLSLTPFTLEVVDNGLFSYRRPHVRQAAGYFLVVVLFVGLLVVRRRNVVVKM